MKSRCSLAYPLSILYYWLLKDSCVVCKGSKWSLSHLEASLYFLWKDGFFSETLNIPIFRTVKSNLLFSAALKTRWQASHFPYLFLKQGLTRSSETIILNLAVFISYLGLSFPPSRHSLHLSNIITSLHTYVLVLRFLVSTILSSLSVWQFPRSCLFSKLSLSLQLVLFLPTPSQSSLFPVHREACLDTW